MGVWARADVRDAFEELIAAHGDEAIGWKIGVASVASMAAADIDAPLIGCLFRAALYESGTELDVSGWVDARLEPEIAVYLGADVPAGASAEQASAAIAAISLAFELVDLDGSLTDAPAMLRGNIFQRGVILGERVPAAAAPSVRVLIDGETHADLPDPIALSGDHPSFVQHVADALGSTGRDLRAGEVIITGTLTPPIPLAPARYSMRGDGLGEIELVIAPNGHSAGS